MQNKYSYLILSLLILFFAPVYAVSTDSTAVGPVTKTSYSRAQLQWQAAGTQSPAAAVNCPSSSVTINSAQQVIPGSFRYINGVTKNWNNLPNGRNVSQQAMVNPPNYGVTCNMLQPNLAWKPV